MMAETTTTRLGLKRWSAGTDTPSRSDFDEAFKAVSERVAGWLPDDTAGNRPAPSAANARFFFRATDSGQLSYSTGTAWVDVPSDEDVTGGVGTEVTAHEAAGDPHAGYVQEAAHTAALHGALDIDHGSMSGRTDDDHEQYALVDGSRPFTGVVPGTRPTGGTHLTTKAYVDERSSVGTVLFTVADAAPDGWLLCDGAAVSRETYAVLFSAIGTTYGAGDEATTFNLPDMRQRFPLGKAASGTGSSLGATGGSLVHTHTNPATDPGGSHAHTNPDTSDVGNHTHSTSGTTRSAGAHMHSSSNTSYPGQGDGFDSLAAHPDYRTSTDGSHSHSFSDSTSTASGGHRHSQSNTHNGGSHTHAQADTGDGTAPYLALNAIIKAT